jgi:hypothetical protein
MIIPAKPQFNWLFLKPQNRFEPNLAEMLIGWSYTRFLFLALIGNPTWLQKIFKISTNQNTLWTLAAMLDLRSVPKTKILI